MSNTQHYLIHINRSGQEFDLTVDNTPGVVVFEAESTEDTAAMLDAVVREIRAAGFDVDTSKPHWREVLIGLIMTDQFAVHERRINGRYIEITAVPVTMTDQVIVVEPDMIEIQEGDDVSEVTRDEFAGILAEAGRDYEVDIVRKGRSASGVIKVARRADNGEVIGSGSLPDLDPVTPRYAIRPIKDTAPAPATEEVIQPTFAKLRNSVKSGRIEPKPVPAPAKNLELTEEELASVPVEGQIIVVVGPSGSGKTTLVREFFGTPNTLTSFTTRDPRPGEIPGKDYYFVSHEEVDAIRDAGDLLEYVEYNGNRYGYTKSEVLGKLKAEGTVTCVATIEGYQHFKNVLGDRVTAIYLDIDKETVVSHLASRDDSEEKRAERLALYEKEAANKTFFEQEPGAVVFSVKSDWLENRDAFAAVLEQI